MVITVAAKSYLPAVRGPKHSTDVKLVSLLKTHRSSLSLISFRWLHDVIKKVDYFHGKPLNAKSTHGVILNQIQYSWYYQNCGAYVSVLTLKSINTWLKFVRPCVRHFQGRFFFYKITLWLNVNHYFPKGTIDLKNIGASNGLAVSGPIHYLNQCRPHFITRYGVTPPQCVKVTMWSSCLRLVKGKILIVHMTRFVRCDKSISSLINIDAVAVLPNKPVNCKTLHSVI